MHAVRQMSELPQSSPTGAQNSPEEARGPQRRPDEPQSHPRGAQRSPEEPAGAQNVKLLLLNLHRLKLSAFLARARLPERGEASRSPRGAQNRPEEARGPQRSPEQAQSSPRGAQSRPEEPAGAQNAWFIIYYLSIKNIYISSSGPVPGKRGSQSGPQRSPEEARGGWRSPEEARAGPE